MSNMLKEKTIWLTFLSILVIVLIAGGLRSPITVVSPVLNEIKACLELNNFQASLLTSIPLIVFATCSVLVSKIAVKTTIYYSLLISLLFLVSGLYLRVYGHIEMLYFGSLLIGLGICIGNVITPGYIKSMFPTQIGLITGIFSVAMNLVAALASGFSISIGEWTNQGWKGSLGIWVYWVLLAICAVLIEFVFKRNKDKTPKLANSTSMDSIIKEKNVEFNIFRSRQAWAISLFMGLQSLIYYCLVALLPLVLIDYGMPKQHTGMVLLVIQLAMLPVMFLGSIIASKIKDQKWMIYSIGLLMFAGIFLLTIFKLQFIYLCATLIGMSGGLAFSLCLVFFSVKSKTTTGTLKISGMAQSVGYFIAAFGPPIFGLLHEWDISWKTSFYFLMLMITLLTIFGKMAAKPGFVDE